MNLDRRALLHTAAWTAPAITLAAAAPATAASPGTTTCNDVATQFRVNQGSIITTIFTTRNTAFPANSFVQIDNRTVVPLPVGARVATINCGPATRGHKIEIFVGGVCCRVDRTAPCPKGLTTGEVTVTRIS